MTKKTIAALRARLFSRNVVCNVNFELLVALVLLFSQSYGQNKWTEKVNFAGSSRNR